GIARGLESLPADRVGAYVSGCDAPLLTRGWMSLLLDCLQDNDIAVAQTEGRPHPLAGAYRSSVAQTAHRLVDAARLRPVYLFDEHATVRVSEATLRGVDPDLESLLNANSPDDYAEVRRRFEKNR